MAILKSYSFDALDIGMSVAVTKTYRPGGPSDEEGQGPLAGGLWFAGLLARLIYTQLPGPGSVCIGQRFSGAATIPADVPLVITLTVTDKHPEDRSVTLEAVAVREDDGAMVLTSLSQVQVPAPARHISSADEDCLVPEQGDRLKRLIEQAVQLGPIKVAIVHPTNETSLKGAIDAAAAGLIEPIFIGPTAKMTATADKLGVDLPPSQIVDVPHSHAGGEAAAELAGRGDVAAIMKGALHTDEVLLPILDAQYGLRTERRLSHVFVMDAPGYHKLLLITDAAVNIQPTLAHKADILQNAAQLAAALGIAEPKAAILSAVETVTPDIPSTLDAAALCKMVDRGQIKGVIADGPFAVDNAISPQAAAIKGLTSPVAGNADITLVPNLEAGNIMAKELDYLGGAVAAGIVMGAQVPIILTSRAEGSLPRQASCALARLVIAHRGEGI